MATFLQDAVTGARQLQALKADKMALEQVQKQQAGIDEASGLLKQYYDSQKAGKPNQELLISATLKSPQLAGQMLDVMGLTDKQEQQRVAGDVSQLYMASQDPQMFFTQASKLRNQYMQEGRDVEDIDEIAIAYKERGPEAALQMMKVLAAPLEAKGYKTGVFAEQGQQRGVPQSIQEIEYYEKLKQNNPELAEKFAKARGYVDTPKEQALTPQERNIQRYQQMVASGDPNAESFGRSAGILSKEGMQLSATAEKTLLDAAGLANQNQTNVTKYLDLASRFKESDIQGGIFGSGGTVREALASALGTQDEVSKTLSDWQKIRSGEAVASLPPGPATDADIRLALKPFPETANAAYMDNYLRGLAKMALYNAEYNQFKADFITENGSLRGKNTNFGKEWEKRRSEVMQRISDDPRFMTQQQTQQPSQPSQQPAQKPKQPVVVGNFTVEFE